ncbi:MAG: fenitrothion hydrolase protein FedB [Solirubrobacterales bacterium]|nr:fenitrothion hydrolase protein FedB [Solirubrobacterales bacterium]
MRAPSRRTLAVLLGGQGLAALALPASADAHGIVGKADLPIPVWLFSWTAAIVLVVSFVALSTMWTRPQLQHPRLRRLFALPRPLEWLAGLLGVALFALVIYSGFDGAQVTQANFSVTFLYVVFWVGLPVASLLFGDVFRAFNPWRTCARALAALARAVRRERPATPLLRYPRWLGVWPAVAVIVGFAWLELVYVEKDHPATLAALSLAYFLVMLAGMALFGVEEWSSQADGFGVYFNLLSKLSALVRRGDGAVYLRRPLSGVTDLKVGAGMVALICTLIGTTTFDGFSNGGIWRTNEPSLQSVFEEVGLGPTPAQELAYSVGLVLCILVIFAVYRVGILGVRKVSERYDSSTLTRTFAHTLVPIAFAYVLAHYFSLLIWQSQAIVYLASDPLGNGANLLGTSSYQIDYHVISYAAIWYVQVAALVIGHVGGLALAHDRALVLYKDPEDAVRSQYWMLAVMVAFTSFGLWLLSAVGT